MRVGSYWTHVNAASFTPGGGPTSPSEGYQLCRASLSSQSCAAASLTPFSARATCAISFSLYLSLCLSLFPLLPLSLLVLSPYRGFAPLHQRSSPTGQPALSARLRAGVVPRRVVLRVFLRSSFRGLSAGRRPKLCRCAAGRGWSSPGSSFSSRLSDL